MNINLKFGFIIKNLKNLQTTSSKNDFEANLAFLKNISSSIISNNPNLYANDQLNNLTPVQQSVFIKALLNLPKEWQELLSLLIYKDITPETLIKLMESQDKKIKMQEIKDLLETNSKEAVNKLLKLIRLTPENPKNIEQIKEAINTISQIIQPNSTYHEILTNIILLYLPWIPLQQQQDLSLKFEKRQSEEEENKKEIALIIYVTTLSLGKFKITIMLNQDNSLNINIENEEKEKSQPYIKQILDTIDQEMLTQKVPAKTQFYVYKPNDNQEKEKGREVSLQPTSSISARIMIVAHSLVKIIFELDEKISLLNNREKMALESLNNQNS
ncbi:MAG: hypothetical protein V2B14_04575 [bacterium]